MWVDNKSETDINNGSLSHKHFWYSYIFNECIEEYKKPKGGFVDYEDFYHFVQKSNSEKNGIIFTNTKNKLFEEHPEFKGKHMFSRWD